MGGNVLFTIGHSNHPIESFLALLQRHEVTTVIDVRSRPVSRYFPHFNKARLEAALGAVGMSYLFLGRELGARPADPACYVDGTARYELIAATPAFASGLERVRELVRLSRPALLCAERDPLVCHRAILVCRHLRQPAFAIEHILADGDLEAHEALERRLVRQHGTATVSPQDELEAAYEGQAERIAFKQERTTSP